MVQQCLEFDSPFGVVLIRQGEEIGDLADPYLVGTACRIEQVHRYPDGRMHISVVGERRFRIRKMDESQAFLVGHVEPLLETDTYDSPRIDALMMRVEEIFRHLITGMLARPDFNIEVQLPEDAMMRSFVIARFLNLDLMTKQRMLECVDSEERIAELIPLIEKQLIESETPRLVRIRAEEVQEWIHPN